MPAKAVALQWASDLHLEFESAPFSGADVVGDVLILAGDLHTKPKRLAAWLASLPPIPILMVLGNHEHYGLNRQDAVRKYREALAPLVNVQLLDNQAVIVRGVRFLGTTLWSSLKDPDGQLNLADASHSNDFRCIRTGPQYRRLQPADVMQLHAQQAAWLETALRTDFAGPTVVITHHPPSFRSVSPGETGVAGYASDLDVLILETQPALWVHGHVHENCDYLIGDTRVVCNPYGYLTRDPNDRNATFSLQQAVALLQAAA